MRKQMIENAAFEVATQVRAVEESIEAALAEMAELQGRMIRARSATGIGVQKSHEAFAKLADAVQAIVGARGAIGDCHVALADAKQNVPGLRTTSFGEGDECPPDTGHAGLRIVA